MRFKTTTEITEKVHFYWCPVKYSPVFFDVKASDKKGVAG
jgi:hypothetical protein